MTFDAEPYLARLKPFQRTTVEHVFDRLFTATAPVDRFLVADEVGLGKTMIARGLVAKMIEHYAVHDPQRRIDVVYVCSNQAIAKQNFSKLAIVGHQREAVTDRITKLPVHLKDLHRKVPGLDMAVNFIPITPSTSFDLRSNVGRVDERALLYELLADDRLLGRRRIRTRGPERLLRSKQVGEQTWTNQKRAARRADIDEGLRDRFVAALVNDQSEDGPLGQFEHAADLFRRRGAWNDHHLRSDRTRAVGDLRRLLARTCIDALEADLIILDEFQRFPKLLDPGERVGALADLLFTQNDAKTLLLSATPYRMLTRAAELDEDHHTDFVQTTKFLLRHDEAAVGRVTSALHRYRSALRGLDTGGIQPVTEGRDVLQDELTAVMCRTERLAATPDRNGMLAPHPQPTVEAHLTSSDMDQFVELDAVAGRLNTSDVVEYWKSAPFPLNFMDDYKLAQDFERELQAGRMTAPKHGLNVERVRALRPVDVGNARLRGLVERLDEENAWPLLWLPPSLPYYNAGRPFDRSTITTKRLIFSAWTVVPKAIAALTSYEAEQHLYSGADGKRSETQPLQWRPDGPMTEVVLSLPYPSLLRFVDPRGEASSASEASLPDRASVLRQTEKRIRKALRGLPDTSQGAADPRWYLVAPLLLEDDAGAAWLDAMDQQRDVAPALARHRQSLRQLASDPSQLRRRPDDLAQVLAKVALAGPGTVALRALKGVFPDEPELDLLPHALDLGLAFRGLFNLPEAYAIVRALSETRSADDVFWKAALDYCVNGNLQAVIDEYLHVLRDWVEDRPAEQGGKPAAIVQTATESIGIMTVDFKVRTFENDRLGEQLSMRSRFAMRLGDGRSAEDEKAVQRVDVVRKAFNSPFWPFVLATTSVGQEGLDFHQYSHAVVHWNLPSNPVDLEQREGRVHRFKGHAVRRNLASAHRNAGLAAEHDPWEAMFNAAPALDEGLQPYWIFADGPAQIERHVPAQPLSRDEQRLTELVRLLGIYRLAFGQPRQEELLAAVAGLKDIGGRVSELLIDLQPTPVLGGAK